jgi:hypothetical protein
MFTQLLQKVPGAVRCHVEEHNELEEEEKRSQLTRTSAAGNPWTAATLAGVTERWFVVFDDPRVEHKKNPQASDAEESPHENRKISRPSVKSD